ncbi:immunoglobulin lambda-1 light chain-like [Sorex fumeus]|uniref:immunoglobulin lambda-1 light chain-like n=1 Tax=Sorex fumeus TaxID=62283 RepID=UPI0024AE124E|nr:immunoglobulin lambda-1 light chain-like [Sorex fumeus]
MKEAEETPEYREIGYPRILVMPQEEPAMPVDPFEAKVDEEDCIEELFLEEFNDTSEMSRDFMVNKEYDSYNDVLQECVNNREKSQVDYDTLTDWVTMSARAAFLYTAFMKPTATLFNAINRVTSQNMIQESLLSTNPGGTVTLTCGSSTGTVTTSNYAVWVQQKPYQKPRGLIGETSHRNPDVPARFSGSLLGNKAILTITGAKEEDKAEYFCALWFRSNSQAVVTQEPSLTMNPGGTVILTYGSSTGVVTDGHYPYWFQQKSGQAPRTMIYDTNKKHPWTPARFSGSILGNKAALTIPGAQSEDEAEYYCSLLYSSA